MINYLQFISSKAASKTLDQLDSKNDQFSSVVLKLYKDLSDQVTKYVEQADTETYSKVSEQQNQPTFVSGIISKSDNDTEKNAMFKLAEKVYFLKDLVKLEKADRSQSITTEYCMTPNTVKVWFDMSTVVLGFICLCLLLVCSIVTIQKVKASVCLSGRQHYKKTVATALLLLGAFTICWIPFISFETFMFFLYNSGTAHMSNFNFQK